jgi:hypothetical protein
MSRFNTSRTGTATTNKEGGKAFKESNKLELVSLLLTTFVQNTFYEGQVKTLQRIGNLVKRAKNKKFVAKTAIFARDQFNMRTGSHIVAGELAGQVYGEVWLKNFYNKVVVRPDDMLEIISYLKAQNKKIPNSMKKGFSLALQDFDEYQIAKYKKTSKNLSIVDVVNLVHPKPTEAISKLVKGTLEAPETWEVLVTQAGSDIEAKKRVWKTLVLKEKLGYMALIRNLRNILEFAPEAVDSVCSQLTNEEKVRKSRMLPFRFFTAIEQVEKLNYDGVRQVIIALARALDIALQNVPKLEGRTLVVLDESGSMEGRPSQIGSMFASTLVKANPNCDLMTFARRARYQNINPLDSTLSIARSIKYDGGGTNFGSIFEVINKDYDRLIVLSDMQGWGDRMWGGQSLSGGYKQFYNGKDKKPKVYSWNLQDYGTLEMPEANVYCLAGWSDKVFDIMKLLESDKEALINEIEKVEL